MKKVVKRKKVLLIGNGPFRDNTTSWSEIINKYNAGNEFNYERKNYVTNVPETIKAYFADLDDISKKKRIEFAFNDYEYKENDSLKRFIEKNEFDVILTTNYTYDIESILLGIYDKEKLKKEVKKYYKKPIGHKENYIIKSYNQISNNKIYHIHGELRNTNSIILDLSTYAGLLIKIISYCREKVENHKNEIIETYQSWIDYILYGDLYVLGFGMAYEEIDLWWLLNWRKRIKNKKNIKLYDFNINDDKRELLRRLNVDIESFEFNQYGGFHSLIYNKKVK